MDEGEEPTENGSVVARPSVVEPETPIRAGVSSQQEDFLDVGEKVVRPGDILHLPTVRTAVKQGESKSFIIVRVSNFVNTYLCWMSN